MSAKCFIGSPTVAQYTSQGIGPLETLQIASGKLDYGVRDFGSKNPLAVKKKTMKTRDVFSVCKDLTDLGDIDLTNPRLSLCLVGTRNSILAALQKADHNLKITVGLPPGVFLGVYRQENFLMKDRMAIKITSGTRTDDEPFMEESDGFQKCGYKRANYYKQLPGRAKRWGFSWFDATDDLGVDATGLTTLHPKAFVTPLKNILDYNKWW